MNQNNADTKNVSDGNTISDKSGINTAVESKVKQTFDSDVNKIHEQHAHEFSEMRRKALNAIPENTSQKPLWPVFGAFTAVASAVFAVVLVLNTPQSTQNAPLFDEIDVVLEEMELEEGDLEMLENDIEFYLWLEENEQV